MVSTQLALTMRRRPGPLSVFQTPAITPPPCIVLDPSYIPGIPMDPIGFCERQVTFGRDEHNTAPTGHRTRHCSLVFYRLDRRRPCSKTHKYVFFSSESVKTLRIVDKLLSNSSTCKCCLNLTTFVCLPSTHANN